MEERAGGASAYRIAGPPGASVKTYEEIKYERRQQAKRPLTQAYRRVRGTARAGLPIRTTGLCGQGSWKRAPTEGRGPNAGRATIRGGGARPSTRGAGGQASGCCAAWRWSAPRGHPGGLPEKWARGRERRSSPRGGRRGCTGLVASAQAWLGFQNECRSFVAGGFALDSADWRCWRGEQPRVLRRGWWARAGLPRGRGGGLVAQRTGSATRGQRGWVPQSIR